jgi:hypothetical protein
LVDKRYLGKTMLLRIAALLPSCSHVRPLAVGPYYHFSIPAT